MCSPFVVFLLVRIPLILHVVYLPLALLKEHQTDANQDLSRIVQDNVRNPKALAELFSERVDDKNYIADQEQEGSQGE